MNQTEKVARWLWLKWIAAWEPDVATLEADEDGDWAECMEDATDLLTLIDQQAEPVDIVFDGPPGPESGRFVEVESPPGRSIRFGEWVERDDGYWVLRFSPPASREPEWEMLIDMAYRENLTTYQRWLGMVAILIGEDHHILAEGGEG